jgi:hypothetical protein
MNQQQLQNYTNSMIDLLSIKMDKNGFYSTSWGKKSFQGLQDLTNKKDQNHDRKLS